MNEQELKKRIAELESLNNELRVQVTELRDFIDNASIPLHWVNGSGIVVWVNQAELDMLGYSKEEVINHHVSKFHADKYVIEDILRRLINRETLLNYPARLLCRDGSIRHVLINSNVYWLDGQFIHTRCFTRDITLLHQQHIEQTKLVEALQKRISELERSDD